MLRHLIISHPFYMSRKVIKKRKKDWYRLKKYVHIGSQHNNSDRSWIEPYVKDKSAIAKHSFMPFIHRELKERRFRRESCHDGTISKLRKPSYKARDIYYCNHFDAKVFSYYSEMLSKKYEDIISEKGIDACVTAYRRIKLNKKNPNSKNKSTVHFANDVFQFIKGKEDDLAVITFDIKSFFDNLNHKYLKDRWKEVMGFEKSLPKDHYNVFRNITKFSYVEEEKLFEMFRENIIVQKPLKNNNKGQKKKIKIDKLKYFKNKGAVSYCHNKDILEIRRRGLIKSNKYFFDETNNHPCGLRDKGIPQGSPISATLANIYMLEFDSSVNNIVKEMGGVYQRYSDDMVVVCPIKYENLIINHFKKSIRECGLEIQKSKTQVFHFIYNTQQDRHYCYDKNINTNKLNKNASFEYLGFQFDGYSTMIKNASLSNYYRKMKKRFARSMFHTYHNKTTTRGEVFKTQLYKSYTYKGSHRRRKHNNKSVEHKHDWGNFITYANLAVDVIPDNKIKGQMKNFWKNFHIEMNKIINKENENTLSN